MASLRSNDSSSGGLSSDEIRDLRRLYKVLGEGGGGGGGDLEKANEYNGLKKVYEFLKGLEDYERDLTPYEIWVCVRSLIVLGGVATLIYKLYNLLCLEEEKIIRKSHLRRSKRNQSSSDRSGSSSGGNSNNNNNSGGNKKDDH